MKLSTYLSIIPILVGNQTEALAFYTEKLGLEKRTDMTFGPGLRLLTVASKGQLRPEIALIHPVNTHYDVQHVRAVMAQREQQAPWVFETDDCYRTYETLQARGVRFVCAPVKQCYGTEAMFVDPFGNAFLLLEASPRARAMLR